MLLCSLQSPNNFAKVHLLLFRYLQFFVQMCDVHMMENDLWDMFITKRKRPSNYPVITWTFSSFCIAILLLLTWLFIWCILSTCNSKLHDPPKHVMLLFSSRLNKGCCPILILGLFCQWRSAHWRKNGKILCGPIQ